MRATELIPDVENVGLARLRVWCRTGWFRFEAAIHVTQAAAPRLTVKIINIKIEVNPYYLRTKKSTKVRNLKLIY